MSNRQIRDKEAQDDRDNLHTLGVAGWGILIGIAATLLMLLHARIMGATGILAGLVMPDSRSDFAWRAADATLAMPRLIIPSLQLNMRAGAVPTDRDGNPMLKVPVNRL